MALLSLTRTATASRDGIYRTNNQTVAAWIATLCTCLFIGLAFVPSKAQLFSAIVAVIMLAMTYRAWMGGVRIDPDGVKIGGLVSSTHVAWSEIDRFTMSARPNGAMGQLIRKDGQPPLVVLAIAAGRTKGSQQRAQAVMDLLNQALDDWRNGSGHQAPQTTA